MADTPKTITVDTEFTVNGEKFTAALVVGPDDVLVLNLGPRATAQYAAEMRERLAELLPNLAGRVLFTAAEGMAAVSAETPERRRKRLADDIRMLRKERLI